MSRGKKGEHAFDRLAANHAVIGGSPRVLQRRGTDDGPLAVTLDRRSPARVVTEKDGARPGIGVD
ncbi:MAG: hypothetical protein JO363_20990 [Solirubrobacterales bacterium]|nr:hypothetical protein [Solirubrobacterales bacterium]